MCVGFGSSAPSVPKESEAAKAEREQRMREEQEETRKRKEAALESEVKTLKRGVGRRTLFSGARGGIGYYQENL